MYFESGSGDHGNGVWPRGHLGSISGLGYLHPHCLHGGTWAALGSSRHSRRRWTVCAPPLPNVTLQHSLPTSPEQSSALRQDSAELWKVDFGRLKKRRQHSFDKILYKIFQCTAIYRNLWFNLYRWPSEDRILTRFHFLCFFFFLCFFCSGWTSVAVFCIVTLLRALCIAAKGTWGSDSFPICVGYLDLAACLNTGWETKYFSCFFMPFTTACCSRSSSSSLPFPGNKHQIWWFFFPTFPHKTKQKLTKLNQKQLLWNTLHCYPSKDRHPGRSQGRLLPVSTRSCDAFACCCETLFSQFAGPSSPAPVEEHLITNYSHTYNNCNLHETARDLYGLQALGLDGEHGKLLSLPKSLANLSEVHHVVGTDQQ